MNLITPDNGEKFLVELENATLTNIQGFLADKPDLTLTINRSDLEQTMMGVKTLEAQIADGTAKVIGDAGVLQMLASRPVLLGPAKLHTLRRRHDRDVLPTPEHAEKAPAPLVERCFSPRATATRLLLYSDQFRRDVAAGGF